MNDSNSPSPSDPTYFFGENAGVKTITIRGFKSIAVLENFELRNLNILIGANGSGKSNFIEFFDFLSYFLSENLQIYIQRKGGVNALLYKGRKYTKSVFCEIRFHEFMETDWGYTATLAPTDDNKLIFEQEALWYDGEWKTQHHWKGRYETQALAGWWPISERIRDLMKSWRCYHFQDTSASAAVKQQISSNDNLVLKPNADNLAAYIAMLKRDYSAEYVRIIETIKLAAPFFGGFIIRDPLPNLVELEWFEQDDPDTPYKAHVLSDGTLRFICLTTLLLQPQELLPATILIDEPELGLHPYAIGLLASMIKQVAETNQIIVSTQSVELLNHFAPDDVVVVRREDGATTLRRLDEEELRDWLEEYTLGELWNKNVLGGRPSR